MGILNLTPDSFYAGSRQATENQALAQAGAMLADGAHFLDLGAVSTRPCAAEVSFGEEKERLLPALKAIRKEFPSALLSIDTFRAEIARIALSEGADIINDISGGQDAAMYSVVAAPKAPYILMHMRGTPQTMAGLTDYANVVLDIQAYFLEKIAAARADGVGDIILDPGLGFAKTIPQNFELLGRLDAITTLGCPVLIGLSRKKMVWQTIGTNPDGALNGTTALHMAALMGGASILRVHDVKPAIETVQLYNSLVHPKSGPVH